MTKRCPKCSKDLELEAFGTRKMGDKVMPQSWCRGCRTKKGGSTLPPAATPRPAASAKATAAAPSPPSKAKVVEKPKRPEISVADPPKRAQDPETPAE